MSLVIDDEAREAELAICGELQLLHYKKGKKAVKKRKIITISIDEEDDSGDTEILQTVCCTHVQYERRFVATVLMYSAILYS